MEYGVIQREIRIDATPDIVFDVVSDPAHVQQWWPDDARYEVVPGSVGEIVFTTPAGAQVPVGFEVVDAVPSRLFSFRWCHNDGDVDSADSLLVTFELTPSGSGTTIRLTETGFREMGWEQAKVAEHYLDHSTGWDTFVPRLGDYVARLVSAP